MSMWSNLDFLSWTSHCLAIAVVGEVNMSNYKGTSFPYKHGASLSLKNGNEDGKMTILVSSTITPLRIKTHSPTKALRIGHPRRFVEIKKSADKSLE